MTNQLMKTCRDCYAGCISLDFGTVSCLKHKDIFMPEAANYCKFYKSTSIKEIPLWRELIKGFKGKVLRRFYK